MLCIQQWIVSDISGKFTEVRLAGFRDGGLFQSCLAGKSAAHIMNFSLRGTWI